MLPTALASSITHCRQGTMIRSLAGPIGVGCLVGSYAGGVWANKSFKDDDLR